MDPFSIALGVLQITGAAIKISSPLKKKIKVFSNYSREVGRVLKSVSRQRKNFLHEVHLLLRLAEQDELDIERMLEDGGDRHWRSPELESGLNSAFPGSLDTIKDVVEEIQLALDDLQGELTCFEDIGKVAAKVSVLPIEIPTLSFKPSRVSCVRPNHHIQNEALKDTIRRVRKRVNIAWNKESFEEQIKKLRELNDDLRRIREQAAEIQQPGLRNAAYPGKVQQLSKEYISIGKVRRASESFHQALAATWLREISGTQSDEVRHSVKLKIEAEVRDEVKMEVLITCFGHSLVQP